ATSAVDQRRRHHVHHQPLPELTPRLAETATGITDNVGSSLLIGSDIVKICLEGGLNNELHLKPPHCWTVTAQAATALVSAIRSLTFSALSKTNAFICDEHSYILQVLSSSLVLL